MIQYGSKAIPVLFAVFLAGCAAYPPAAPALDGKPRVKINQQIPEPAATDSQTSATKTE